MRSRFVLAGLLGTVAAAANAGVTVADAWIRGTVPGQGSTGAFLTITSTEPVKLVGAASPVARDVEIHMSMTEGGMAHMHAVEAVELPAGKAVRLQPGGHHIMLMGLSAPLKAGESVPLSLAIEDSKGKRSKVELRLPVRPLGQ